MEQAQAVEPVAEATPEAAAEATLEAAPEATLEAESTPEAASKAEVVEVEAPEKEATDDAEPTA
jgi:hypothetical protein